MTPRQFRHAGELLYGRRYHTAFAEALGISRKHVSRLSAGEFDVKPSLAFEVRKLLRGRMAEADSLLAELSVARE